jgi:hypothetical protein
MDESRRQTRFQAGQRWLQALVQALLAQAAMPLAAGTVDQPSLSWEAQAGARYTLSLWLWAETTPRHLSFPVALIEDCGAGMRMRHSYARFYIVRSLHQMGVF